MTMRSVKPLRLAMVGCGGRANVHAPAAARRNDVEIIRWLDLETEKAKRLAAQHNGKVASSWDAILEDNAIDGIVVALPHNLHYDYGMAALRAGKHVMMEIPIAATPEQAQEMIAAAKQADVMLLVLHSLRFWRSHRTIAELVASGVLGEPIFARYHNEHTVPEDYFALRPGQFAAEAGVLHHGDVMRWWVGDVTAVTARGLSVGPTAREHGTFDHITVLYEMTGNALGETTCSWVTKACEQNRMVRGSVSCQEGTVVLTWNDEVRVFSPDGQLDRGERFAMFHPGRPDGPRDEIGHFADCIRGTCAPVVSPEDALRALELTLAARTSAREGRRIEMGDCDIQTGE